MSDKKFVIAISRECGSGGGEVARKLASKLGVPCYDKNVRELMADESGLSKEAIKLAENKSPSVFDYHGFTTQNGMLPVRDRVFILQSNILKDLAQKNSCVILGRCASVVLKDYENCLRVFVCAPKEKRIQRIVNQHGLNEKEAEKLVNTIDKNRKTYLKKYTDSDWDKAQNYELCVNTEFGVDNAVNVILEYFRNFVK